MTTAECEGPFAAAKGGLMKWAIGDETRQCTMRCKKGFACLAGERELCAVEHCVDGVVHFIRCKNSVPCSYQLNFGDGVVCLCPIRKELYNRYKL
jgi:hypothetical protein